MIIPRRSFLGSLAVLPLVTRPAFAQAEAREIEWEELIPEGVPYSEIVAEGEYNEAEDIWLPVFDANAYKFAEDLDGQRIRMPGFVLPLENGADGVTEFILTPYAGACIHVPPPPANQLVFVTTQTPWASDDMFEAVWVSGVLTVNPISTTLAEIGYALAADGMEIYEWT